MVCILPLDINAYLYRVMESRRQQKVSRLVQKEISGILQKDGSMIYGSALVTVTQVRITPDLLVARIYLSIFNTGELQDVLDSIAGHAGEIRFKLGNKLRSQVRRVPELEFYLDDTLDSVFRMEEIFKDLNNKENEENPGNKSD